MAGLGVFCLAYFVIIRLAMGKWSSTFAGFWAAAGIGCLAARLLAVYLPGWLESGLKTAFFIALFIFIAVEVRIFAEVLVKREGQCDYLIVLGAQIQGDQVTESLKRRLDKAMEYLDNFPGTRLIVSGGKGSDEAVSEAEAMRDYLVAHGVEAGSILMEDKSTTTKENLKFSARLIGDISCPVGIVTNNFHIYRARKYAARLGYKDTYGMAAGCSKVMLLNYGVREFFAVWKMWICG